VRDSHPSGLKLSAKNKKIIKTKSSIILFKKAELKIYPIYQKRDYWDKHLLYQGYLGLFFFHLV
jgi:adenine-specific DNA-methyltransferase